MKSINVEFQDDGDDSDEIVIDLKGKAGRSRRSSSFGGGSALPKIRGGSGGVYGKSPVPGYNKQLYNSERSSPVADRIRSPSAGPSARVDWKAKYLK